MKATLAPTPSKMAREMLEADRRAQKRRHRARRARKVNTPCIVRAEMFEIEPGVFGVKRVFQPERITPERAAAAIIRAQVSAVTTKSAPAPRPLTPYLDLLLAAILWGTALVCVGLTLAIAAGIALHLFGVE